MAELGSLLAELTCGDDARAEKAIPQILALGKAALPATLQVAHSEDPEARWWAIRVLAEMQQTQADVFIPFLNDSDSDVRAAAALALCSHPSEEAVPVLLESLKDLDHLTASLAANAIRAIGSSAVPSLIESLNEPDAKSPNARILMLRVLAEISDPRAIPALMRAIDEDSSLAQYWANIGLGRMGMDMIYLKPS